MRILKEYEIKLNLTSQEMYSGMLSEPQYLLNYIKERFEGKCLDGTFITNIRLVSEHSQIRMDKNDLTGGGSMCCVFRAEAIIFPPETILVGCEVSTIERDGRIICKYDNAIIHLKGDKRFSPNKGDLIPIRVIRTGYPTGSINMNIAAQPFFIKGSFHMRLCVPNTLTAEEQDLIDRKLSEITDTKKAYDTCDKKLVQFFENLFYPFKDKPSGKNKLPFEVQDLLQLVKKTDGQQIILSRHSAIVKSTTDVLVLDVDTVKNLPQSPWTDKNRLDIQIVPAKYSVVLLELLDDYCSFLDFIVQCCNTYNTEAIRKKHQKIWTIYETIKIV
jgi:hypothetical protein